MCLALSPSMLCKAFFFYSIWIIDNLQKSVLCVCSHVCAGELFVAEEGHLVFGLCLSDMIV